LQLAASQLSAYVSQDTEQLSTGIATAQHSSSTNWHWNSTASIIHQPALQQQVVAGQLVQAAFAPARDVTRVAILDVALIQSLPLIHKLARALIHGCQYKERDERYETKPSVLERNTSLCRKQGEGCKKISACSLGCKLASF
jgi:hypothetical protein